MKKLLSLLLVVLMLGSVTAFAENAPALVISNPVLELTVDGETRTADLTGLEVILGLLTDEDNPGLCLNILGNDQPLLVGEALLQSSNIILSMDGLSKRFAVPVFELLGGEAGSAMANLYALRDILQREAIITRDEDSVTVRLPYTAVNTILTMLRDQIYNIDYRTGMVLDRYLRGVVGTDSGYEAEFVCQKEDTGYSARFALYPAVEGVVSANAYVRGDAVLRAGENGVYYAALDLVMDEEGNGKGRELFALNGSLGPDGDGSIAFDLEVSQPNEETLALEPAFGLAGKVTPLDPNTYGIEITVSEKDYWSEEYGVIGGFSGTLTMEETGPVLHLDVYSPTEEDGKEIVGAVDAFARQSDSGYDAQLLLSNIDGEDVEEFFLLEGYAHRTQTGYQLHLGTSEEDYTTDTLMPSFALDATVIMADTTMSLRVEVSEKDYSTRELRVEGAMEASVTFAPGGYGFRLTTESYNYSKEKLTPDFQLEGTLSPSGDEIGVSFTVSEYDYSDDALRPEFGFEGTLTNGETEKRAQFTVSEYSYQAEELAPVFAFDGQLTPTATGATFNAALFAENYYSDDLQKVLVLEGAFVKEAAGGTMSCQIFADLDGEGKLSRIALFDGSARQEGDGWTVKGLLKIAPRMDENFVDAAQVEAHFGSEFTFDADILELGAIHMAYDTQSGAMRCEVEGEDFHAVLTGSITVREAEIRRPVADGDSPVNLLHLSDEQAEQYTAELQSALAQLIGFVYPALVPFFC